MKSLASLVISVVFFAWSAAAVAQAEPDDTAALQKAAVEALMSAPPERALPLARKVVQGDYDAELKISALFVLSQISEPEAQELILAAARSGSGELRDEAIRMIGISGQPEALAQLREFWAMGDPDLRDAVLEAYLIAGDEDAVYDLALNAQDNGEFEQAVETLAAMGAQDKLRQLREHAKLGDGVSSEALIEAYAMSGDFESLRELATDDSDRQRQVQAIESLGIVGGDRVNQLLVDIYRSASSGEVRDAALQGMMISDYDEGLLALYRESDDAAEKRQLLEMLVAMDSDEVWQIIDQALDGGR